MEQLYNIVVSILKKSHIEDGKINWGPGWINIDSTLPTNKGFSYYNKLINDITDLLAETGLRNNNNPPSSGHIELSKFYQWKTNKKLNENKLCEIKLSIAVPNQDTPFIKITSKDRTWHYKEYGFEELADERFSSIPTIPSPEDAIPF
jgi:hypothetical protein